MFRGVAGDESGVDGADRGADDPVWFDRGFAEGLIDAGLIRAERTTTLQHQNHLTRLDLSQRSRFRRSSIALSLHVHPPVCRDLELRASCCDHVQCAVHPPSTGTAVPAIECGGLAGEKYGQCPKLFDGANRLFGCCASSTSRITFSREMPVCFSLAINLRLDQRRVDVAGAESRCT